MLRESKPAEVQLALNLLEQANHETLETSLINLIDHSHSEIRTDALNRIARLQVESAAAPVAKQFAVETDPTAKGTALLALCATTQDDNLEIVSDEYLDDPEPAIRLGAMVGLLKYGGIGGRFTINISRR